MELYDTQSKIKNFIILFIFSYMLKTFEGKEQRIL